jgi:hypothetical protein
MSLLNNLPALLHLVEKNENALLDLDGTGTLARESLDGHDLQHVSKQ